MHQSDTLLNYKTFPSPSQFDKLLLSPNTTAKTYKTQTIKQVLTEKQKKVALNYKHCRGGFPAVGINPEHGAGIGIKLVHELWLALKHLVVLSHEVSSNLNKTKHKKFSTKKRDSI